MQRRKRKLQALLQEMNERSYDHTITKYDHTAVGKFNLIYREYILTGGDVESFLPVLENKVQQYLEEVEQSKKDRFIHELRIVFGDVSKIKNLLSQFKEVAAL